MAVRYQLPDAETRAALSAPQPYAVSIYTETAATVNERERAEGQFRSSVNAALGLLRERGVERADIEQFQAAAAAIEADRELWGGLSRSLAVFIAPGISDVFILPNRLQDAVHVAARFNTGQLLRALTVAQEAYALTLSANAWAIWHATESQRATELELEDDESPQEADDVLTLSQVRARSFQRKFVGDEGKKALLDTYALRIADTVAGELARRDPSGTVPLVVFSAEPLESIFRERFRERGNGRATAYISGAADRLSAAEVDAGIRERLDGLNIAEAARRLSKRTEGSDALVERDLAAIAKAAAQGAVAEFTFDFTTAVAGRVDMSTGDLEFGPGAGGETSVAAGDDVLPLIAELVLSHGGDVFAVRGEELPESWTPPALAVLRHRMVA